MQQSAPLYPAACSCCGDVMRGGLHRRRFSSHALDGKVQMLR